MKLKKFKQVIEDWMDTLESSEYFKNEKIKENLLFFRFNQFENWLNSNNFDILIEKVITKHNKYKEQYLNKKYQFKPTNILGFIIEYIQNKFDIIDVDQLKVNFPNQVWFFKGYYFQIIYNQGSTYKIYDNKFQQLIQI